MRFMKMTLVDPMPRKIWVNMEKIEWFAECHEGGCQVGMINSAFKVQETFEKLEALLKEVV